MPREGVLGQATRIEPVPADHEALDSLSAREDLGGGELVLRTADGDKPAFIAPATGRQRREQPGGGPGSYGYSRRGNADAD